MRRWWQRGSERGREGARGEASAVRGGARRAQEGRARGREKSGAARSMGSELFCPALLLPRPVPACLPAPLCARPAAAAVFSAGDGGNAELHCCRCRCCCSIPTPPLLPCISLSTHPLSPSWTHLLSSPFSLSLYISSSLLVFGGRHLLSSLS